MDNQWHHLVLSMWWLETPGYVNKGVRDSLKNNLKKAWVPHKFYTRPYKIKNKKCALLISKFTSDPYLRMHHSRTGRRSEQDAPQNYSRPLAVNLAKHMSTCWWGQGPFLHSFVPLVVGVCGWGLTGIWKQLLKMRVSQKLPPHLCEWVSGK